MKKTVAKLLLLLISTSAIASESTVLYWYNSKTAPFFKSVASKLQPGDTPEFVCLSWMKPCTAGKSDHAVVRNQYLKGTKTESLPGIPNNGLAEVYHNGWYHEPGLYFYVLAGSGTFLNVGKTLIARNKVDALKKLGLSDRDILRSLPITTFRLIAEDAEEKKQSFYMSLHDILQHMQTGQSYKLDRLNETMSVDFLLYERARKKGYDTVQLTNQPNGNGGWAFEIVDVRSDLADDLKTRWKKQHSFLIGSKGLFLTD